jgi:hypothetical protein
VIAHFSVPPIDLLAYLMNNMTPDEEGTPLDWGKHEAEVLDLFVTQNRPLKEVVKYMEEKHRFVATYALTWAVPGNLTRLTHFAAPDNTSIASTVSRR